MDNNFRILILIIFSGVLLSCGKVDTQKEVSNTSRTGQNTTEEETDTSLTPEESFSTALVQDILGDENDPDLETYLEEQIYPSVSKSQKVTIDKISASMYLLTYDEPVGRKNILIQKFYDPSNDGYVFEKTQTDLNTFRQFIK